MHREARNTLSRFAATVALVLAGLAVATLPQIPASAADCTVDAATTRASVAASGTPDYADPNLWLSLDTTGTLPVDVFYLYPTEYTRETSQSPVVGPIDDPGMIQGAQEGYLRQATAFEPVGNIFAPYYRQADAAARADMPQDEQIAVVAGAPTQDGIAAFEYFIKHHNKGRPFILVGHSLGSNVMANLLAEYMPAHPDVYKRMVAAYVVGYSITPSYLAASPHLKFATGADDTGVIVSWNTEGPILYGTNPVTLPGGLAINPISWTRTETTATAEQNLGSILLKLPSTTPVLNDDGTVTRFMGIADARVDIARGVVVSSTIPEALVADFTGGFPKGVYHPFDYPFYYFDVRYNAAKRAQRFTCLSAPGVSPARPARSKNATFSTALTPSTAAASGATTLSLYHQETKSVRKKTGGVWKQVKVKYWRLRATKPMTPASGGRLTLSYALPVAGAWKMSASYSAPYGYNPSTSVDSTFTVK